MPDSAAPFFEENTVGHEFRRRSRFLQRQIQHGLGRMMSKIRDTLSPELSAMPFKFSRLRCTFFVCDLLSGVAMLAALVESVVFFFNVAKPSNNHVLRLAGALGTIIVPFLTKGVALEILLGVAAAIGIVKKSAVARLKRHTRQGPKVAPRTRRIGNWVGGHAVLNFGLHWGLVMYATTFPEVEARVAGGYFWSDHGRIHEVPKLLYNIGMVQGPIMILTWALAMVFFGGIALKNWHRKRTAPAGEPST